MKKNILILLLLSVVFFGCYYDKEAELYGITNPCDVSNVTYRTTVVAILQNYGCISCHSGVAASGGISLNTYSSVKTQVTNGKLLGSINQSSGISFMPKGGNKMLSCDINKIKAWIDAGSSDN